MLLWAAHSTTITCYAGVLVQGDLALIQHIVEGRPTTSCVEFRAGTEEFLAAHDADVGAHLAVLVEGA